MQHVRILFVISTLVFAACGSKTPKESGENRESEKPGASTGTKDVARSGASGESGASPGSAAQPIDARPADAAAARTGVKGLRKDEVKTDPEAYKKELARGRALEKKAQYAQAVEAFQKAIAAQPGDPVALSELSWAAFQHGDLERANKAGIESVAGARNKKLQAMSLYNLGRIAEKRGQRNQAISHYRQSLTLRPNRTVRARLTKLGALDTLVGVAWGEAAEDDPCAPDPEFDDGEPCWFGEEEGEEIANAVRVGQMAEGFPEHYYFITIRDLETDKLYSSNMLFAHGAREDASFTGPIDPQEIGADRRDRLIIHFTYQYQDSGGDRYALNDEDYEGPEDGYNSTIHDVFCAVGGGVSCIDIESAHGKDEIEGLDFDVIGSDRLRISGRSALAGKYRLDFP